MIIPLRGWIIPLLAAAILIAVGVRARADDNPATPRHQRPGRATCVVVKEFVAMVGEAQAEKMAREAGASEARMAAAKRCLAK